MSDVMLFGVLKMPYELAMSTELSRRQFYDRVQELVARFEAKQPAQQEPAFWTRKRWGVDREFCEKPFTTDWEPLYTSPPASKPWVQATTWRGLTDEERNWLRKRNQKHDDYAKAVEALLKEKNQ